MLEWNDVFITDNKTVDVQHEKLFEMINNFETSLLNGTAEASINETLQFLGNYVVAHFTHEEKEMANSNCPAAEENKKQHAAFLEAYGKYVERFKTEGYSAMLAYELLRTAQNWIVDHICGTDVNLRSYPSQVPHAPDAKENG